MLTYQIRPRVYRLESGDRLEFPAECELCFHFQPAQPFGEEAGGGHTGVRGKAASVLFNANNGQHVIESTEPLSPLDVTLREPVRVFRLLGRSLTISDRYESFQDMDRFITSVYFALPTLLNISFTDPPFVERVDGRVGSSTFRWELSDWRISIRTTTQEEQEQNVANAWLRMSLLAEPHRRRLIAALHYFHVACRLARVGSTAGEFVAEVILNLAKVLEVLYPPTGDGRTRDAAREGLRELGFEEGEIERSFIPAMALRNEIDVGHVELGLFTPSQLKVIHGYSEQAEDAFRDLLNRLLTRIESGEGDVIAHELGSPRSDVIRLVERLERSMAERDGEHNAAES